MKVITIKQPYASLIVEGLKKYEFRTWKTNYRGKILIHAGKSVDKKAMKKFQSFNLEYPVGAIIGSVEIVDAVYIDDKMRECLKKYNSIVYKSVIEDTSWSGYGFELINPQKIEPIYMNGKLGLWNYDIK